MIEISRIIESINNEDKELFDAYLTEATIVLMVNYSIKPGDPLDVLDFTKLDEEVKKYRYNIFRRLSSDPSASNFISLTRNYSSAYLEETESNEKKIKLAFKMIMSYLSFIGLFSKLNKNRDKFFNNLVRSWYLSSNEGEKVSLCSLSVEKSDAITIVKYLTETFNSIIGNDKDVILGSANKLIDKMSDIVYGIKSKEIYKDQKMENLKTFGFTH